MEDTVKYNLKSSMGFEGFNSNVAFHIEYVNYEHKPTLAEKKRNKIVDTIKRRKSIFRKILIGLIMAVWSTLCISLILFLIYCGIITTELNSILFSVLCCQLIILGWLGCQNYIETDVNYITVRGKLYW